MRIAADPPLRGQNSGRLMRMAGIFGMLVGATILAGTSVGVLKPFGDRNFGYMVGGLVLAYGLFRYLRGKSSAGSGPARTSRYQR